MNALHKVLLALALAFLVGCVSTQTLEIATQPEGADVSMQLRGRNKVDARVGAVVGSVKADRFEEDFFDLGNAPVFYEFRLKQHQGGVEAPEGGVSVIRQYEEGIIRVELEGYRTVERRVRFSGTPIFLEISLEPEPMR